MAIPESPRSVDLRHDQHRHSVLRISRHLHGSFWAWGVFFLVCLLQRVLRRRGILRCSRVVMRCSADLKQCMQVLWLEPFTSWPVTSKCGSLHASISSVVPGQNFENQTIPVHGFISSSVAVVFLQVFSGSQPTRVRKSRRMPWPARTASLLLQGIGIRCRRCVTLLILRPSPASCMLRKSVRSREERTLTCTGKHTLSKSLTVLGFRPTTLLTSWSAWSEDEHTPSSVGDSAFSTRSVGVRITHPPDSSGWTLAEEQTFWSDRSLAGLKSRSPKQGLFACGRGISTHFNLQTMFAILQG